MPEKLILEKIRSVRRRLSVQRVFQTLAGFLCYGLLACVPLFIIDSFIATFDISPLILLWERTRSLHHRVNRESVAPD